MSPAVSSSCFACAHGRLTMLGTATSAGPARHDQRDAPAPAERARGRALGDHRALRDRARPRALATTTSSPDAFAASGGVRHRQAAEAGHRYRLRRTHLRERGRGEADGQDQHGRDRSTAPSGVRRVCVVAAVRRRSSPCAPRGPARPRPRPGRTAARCDPSRRGSGADRPGRPCPRARAGRAVGARRPRRTSAWRIVAASG